METLNAIYSETYNFVYLRAKTIFSKEDDIQQLMREVYIKAMEEEVREDRLFAWLGKEVYSLGCGKFRKKKVSEAHFLDLEEQEYHVAASVDLETTKEVICEKLEELPDMHQATLYAFYYDHLSIKDIATMMGYNNKVIVNRLNYVHKYLRKALAIHAEEKQVDVAFSVEAVCAALEEWSKKNQLHATVAQNVFGSICRELSIQLDYTCQEEEDAGVQKRMVERGEEAMSALIEELKTYREKEKKEFHPAIPLVVIGGIAIVALSVFLFFSIKSKETKKADATPKEEKPVIEEQREEEIVEEVAEEQTEESEYIFPTSDTALLTRADLEGMGAKELRLARNEIFARYGTIFGPEDLKEYFGRKSWYVPKITFDQFYDSVEMSQIEEANVSLIQQVEKEISK